MHLRWMFFGIFLAAAPILAGCAGRAVVPPKPTPPVVKPEVLTESERFCRALDQILAAQEDDFVSLRGRPLGRDSWAAALLLPRTQRCLVRTVTGPEFECRGADAQWSDQAALKSEFQHLEALLDHCLVYDAGEGSAWYASALNDNPPGFAKFYKNGRRQVFVTTSQDVQSKRYFNTIKIHY